MTDTTIKPFDAYEVHGCKEFGEGGGKFIEQVDDAEAQFWTLYGHVDGEGVLAIGDFRTRAIAEEFEQRITAERDRMKANTLRLLESLKEIATGQCGHRQAVSIARAAIVTTTFLTDNQF